MPNFTYQQRTTHYLDRGHGPVIILLHGLGSCADDWKPQMEALATSHRVIAPDFRGHGKSSVASSPFSMQTLAKDIKALTEHLQLNKYQVVGFSLGGMVAFELALLCPADIVAMVIINSGPAVATASWSIKCQLQLRLLIIRLLGMRRLGQIIGKKLFVKNTHQQLAKQFAEQMAHTDATSYRYTLKAISRFTLLGQLKRITMPVLVISADQDYTPVAFKQDYVSQLPNASLVVITDSRHATPLDQPDVLNQHLCEFLLNSTRMPTAPDPFVSDNNSGKKHEITP